MNVSFLTFIQVCITWLDVSDGAKSQTAKKKKTKQKKALLLSVEPIDKETLSQLHIQADML